MASFTKKFLCMIKSNWKQEFPCLEPVESRGIPGVIKGSVFVCKKYFTTRGVYYFLIINFNQHMPEKVTLTISVSPDICVAIRQPLFEFMTPTTVGSYLINHFMERPSYEWILIDLDAFFFNTLNVPPRPSDLRYHNPNQWHPESYDRPIDETIEAAISDINSKIRLFVFPKLMIDCHE